MAASMACVSYGLRFFSPLRSRRPEDGLIRLVTAASGTSLTRTQIFMASPWANGRCGTLPGSLTRKSTNRLPGDGAPDELDDVLRRRAGREDLGDAELLELRDVLAGDRPADGHHDVLYPLLAQQLHDARDERHMCAGEDRQPDGVGVLLDDRLDDLLGRLVQ